MPLAFPLLGDSHVEIPIGKLFEFRVSFFSDFSRITQNLFLVVPTQASLPAFFKERIGQSTPDPLNPAAVISSFREIV